MGVHRIYVESLADAGQIVRVEGDEARHAVRVKRLQPGDRVQLLDGAGTVAEGVLQERDESARRGDWVAPVRVLSVDRVTRVIPEIHVVGATPKGSNLDEMIDALSQTGAASWSPLMTARGVVDPRETKLARIARLAAEASKQCGRAWAMTTGASQSLAEALAWREGSVVMADGSGGVYRATGASRIRMLIGPEGGWTEQELEAGARSGAQITSFGPHAMRIETAATVATGIVLATERGERR